MTPAIQRAVDWRDQRSTHGKEIKMANNLQKTFLGSHMIHLPIFFRVTPRASLADMGEIGWYQGAVQYIGYPSKTQLKPISRKISFARHLFLSNLITLKFCTEYGSITAVLCPKFQNDLATKTNFMDERDFARFEFKVRLRAVRKKWESHAFFLWCFVIYHCWCGQDSDRLKHRFIKHKLTLGSFTWKDYITKQYEHIEQILTWLLNKTIHIYWSNMNLT